MQELWTSSCGSKMPWPGIWHSCQKVTGGTVINPPAMVILYAGMPSNLPVSLRATGARKKITGTPTT